MRSALLVIAFILGFGTLSGCSSSDSPQSGIKEAPPPEDSGADKNADKKGGKGRLPPPLK